MRSHVALAILAAAGCSSPPAAAPVSPLARARAEETGWSRVAFVETRGTIAVGSLAGELTMVEDVRDGRERTDFSLGQMSGGEGFDGKVRWRRDPGGEVVIADAPEERALSRTQQWLTRRGYLAETGAQMKDLGTREAGGRRYTVVEAVPEGGVCVELWFDAATHLLARTVHAEGIDTVTFTYDDYRDIGGVRVAFKIVQDSGDPRNRATITLASATLKPAVPDATFAAPATASEQVGFVNGAHRTELPFDLINNHIYIDAKVGGQPVRVLVDTGGQNVLRAATAKRLGLATEGKLAGRGGGDEQVDVSVARPKSLEVGDLRMGEPVFFVFDLPQFDDVEGVDADGIVGFELFHRYVVRIDYAALRISLADPATFTPPAGAIKVPFVLQGRTPRVDGTIDGRPARFTIDTGARNSLTANAPFVAKHGLVAHYKPRFETIAGWGVGGPVRAWPVRFPEVTLGGATVRGVAGELFTGTKSAHADPDSDGNVGAGILRRFVVTFDYGQRAMYLEPIAGLAERDPYDRSGMFVKRAGAALEVVAVTAGGPAERAGLHEGDRIVTVDGKPVADQLLPEWRRRFREDPVGARLALGVERAGKRTTATLVLQELLP